jgi:putative ABC transport system permease protein
MSTITRTTATPRAADIWGLALAAARRQKARTALTIIGVVLGTFTLVVSLSVGQGIERAIVTLFHQDDRLRKIAAHATFQENAEDVPESEREPRGPMSEAKRQRIRRALVRSWHGMSAQRRSNRLDASAIRRIGAIGHVARVEPMVSFDGTAKLGGNAQEASVASVLVGSQYFADRLLAGRLFTADDGRAAIVHEYLLYRWGLVRDLDASAALGQTIRLEYRSSPPDSLHLNWLLNNIGAVGVAKKPALEAGLKRLAAVVRFLPIPRDERDALRTFFDRIPATSATRTEQTFVEAFTIVGVFRERSESDDRGSLASPFGHWFLRDIEIALPAATAAEFYLRSPDQANAGFNEVIVTVDNEAHVKEIADRITAMGYDQYSFAGFIDTIRMNVRLITFAMASLAVLALVVAAIGITNTMIMSVLERAHEIGIMKALGARDRDVRRIFLVEGMLIGCLGSGLGLALGWLASFPGNAIAQRIVDAQKELPLKGTLFIYPVWLVTGVPVLVCVITTLAALYPASRAARVDPVTSLRHE